MARGLSGEGSYVDGLFEARGVVTDIRGRTPPEPNFLIVRGSDAGKRSTTPDTFTGSLGSGPDSGPCEAGPGGPVQDGEVVVQDS
jgi:hypothetical protein